MGQSRRAGGGRKPLPTPLKVIQGTARKDRIRADEPKPEVQLPELPNIVSKEAVREWHRVAPELAELGLLTGLDRAFLIAYCHFWSVFSESVQLVNKHGVIIPSRTTSEPKQNPAVGSANRAFELMLKCGIEFGMTPSSRTRIGTGMKDAEDEMAKLLGSLS